MKRTEAAFILQSLMRKNGLFQDRWDYEIKNLGTKKYGTCSVTRKKLTEKVAGSFEEHGHWYILLNKKIILNLRFVENFNEEDITETILHEIAHALDFEKRHDSNHDYNWYNIYKSIGGTQIHSHAQVGTEPIPRKYIGTCPRCKTMYHKDKMLDASCGKFGNGSFDPNLKLIWNKDPIDKHLDK